MKKSKGFFYTEMHFVFTALFYFPVSHHFMWNGNESKVHSRSVCTHRISRRHQIQRRKTTHQQCLRLGFCLVTKFRHPFETAPYQIPATQTSKFHITCQAVKKIANMQFHSAIYKKAAGFLCKKLCRLIIIISPISLIFLLEIERTHLLDNSCSYDICRVISM